MSLNIIEKNWEHLPSSCKDAFKAVGVDFDGTEDAPTLIEVLKPHLEKLPDDVKRLVEKEAGVPETPSDLDLTKKLKVAVGLIRDQSAKKEVLQQRADQAKTSYKALLEELKGITESIEKAQQELKAISKDYSARLAAQAKEEVSTPKASPTPEPQAMDEDHMQSYQVMLQEVGVVLTAEQQAQMEAKWMEHPPKEAPSSWLSRALWVLVGSMAS